MTRCSLLLLVCVSFALPADSHAGPQDEPQESADATAESTSTADITAELDAFRNALFESFNRGDYETMLQEYCHPDVIATWQDGTSGQGYDAVLAEFDKLSKFIDKMTVQPDTDMRLLYADGQMVVAAGNMRDHYALARGVDVDLDSRWTATLVKADDRWQLVSFSASTNAFQNEVISLYLRNTLIIAAAIAGILGLVVGGAGGWLLTRRRKSA